MQASGDVKDKRETMTPVETPKGDKMENLGIKRNPELIQGDAKQIFKDLHESLTKRLRKYADAFASSSSLNGFFIDYFRCNNVIEILSSPYIRLFQSFHVKSVDELGKKIEALKEESQDDDFQKWLNKISAVENEWDDLLLEIDQRMIANHITSKGFQSVIPDSIELIDCDTEQPTTLKSCLDTEPDQPATCPTRYGVNVFIVCKGSKEGGKKWRKRIGLKLRVLADERAHLAESFDFPLAIWNVAKTAMCQAWAHKVLTDKPLTDDHRADLYQTGGEVLMDASGNILHVHKCRTPDDRPSCDDLLQLVGRKNQESADSIRKDTSENSSSSICAKFCSIM